MRTGLKKVTLTDEEKGRQRRVAMAYKGTFQRALHVEEDHEDPKIRRQRRVLVSCSDTA